MAETARFESGSECCSEHIYDSYCPCCVGECEKCGDIIDMHPEDWTDYIDKGEVNGSNTLLSLR